MNSDKPLGLHQISDAYKCVMLENDVNHFISNVDAIEMDFLPYQNGCLPVSICHSDRTQTWVVSPLSLYVDYAQEETLRHVSPTMAKIINGLLSVLKKALQQQHFAKAAMLNNWLVSTNLYPVFDKCATEQVIQIALKRYPHHALWWRSLNGHQHAPWLHYLKQQGFCLIPSRRIFLLDEPATHIPKKRDWQRDIKLSHTTALTQRHNHQFQSDEDYANIVKLYNQLYLDKYSRLNPQYTPRALKAWHQAQCLYFQGWENAQGRLCSIAGSIHNQHQLTTPIFGFDTDLPQKMGLYRLTNWLASEYAVKHNMNINMSAGAGRFKQNRGAQAHIEYSAVYVKHLPWMQQMMFRCVQMICLYLGKPMLEHLDV